MMKLSFCALMIGLALPAFATSPTSAIDPIPDNKTEAMNTKDPRDCPTCKAKNSPDQKITDPSLLDQSKTVDSIAGVRGKKDAAGKDVKATE